MSADLRSAIVAACTPTGADQAAANVWLNQFSETDAAWEATARLLGDSDEQVRFFAANILLAKTRKSWHCLSLEVQQRLLTSCSKHVESESAGGGSTAVCSRLCLLLASMSIFSGQEVVTQFLATALHFGGINQQGVQTCFWMLKALPEEMDMLEIVQQRKIAEIMQRNVNQFLGIFQSTLLSPMSGSASLHLLALQCLVAWMQLGHAMAKSGHAILFPYSVAEPGSDPQGAVLGNLLQLLGNQDEFIGELASDAAAEILAVFVYEGSRNEQWLVSSCVSGLLPYEALVSVPTDNGCARNVAKVASALAGNFIDTLICLPEQAVKLSEIMLQCIARRDDYVAELVLDFFTAVAEIPATQRPLPLQEAAFKHLLPHLLQLSCYPDKFKNWEECLQGEDSFDKFRDETLSEGIEICFGTLRASCGLQDFIIRVLQNPQSWQSVEASIYCLRAVAKPLMTTITGEANKGQIMSQDLILGIFQSLSTNKGPLQQYMANGHLIQTLCRFLMDFSPLVTMQQFHKHLAPAIKFVLMHGLGSKEGRKWAPKAFRKLCITCQAQLANADTIVGLSQEIATLPSMSAGSPEGLAMAERAPLWEVLARLTAQLDAETASSLGCQIVQPILIAIQSAVDKGAGGSVILNNMVEPLSTELELLSSVIRFLEGKGTPALQLVRGSWNVVHNVLQLPCWVASEQVVSSASLYFQRSILACRVAVLELVPNLLTTTGAIFGRFQYPCCLELLSKAIEMFGREGNSYIDGVLTDAMKSTCQAMSTMFQGDLCAAQHEVLIQFFVCMDKCLLFAPRYLVSLSAFPLLLEWSTKAIKLKEREPVEAALAFLTHVLSPGRKQRDAAERAQVLQTVHSTMRNEGQKIVEQLLWTGCSTCPRHLLKAVASAFRGLIEDEGFGQSVSQWIVSTIQHPWYNATFGRRLTEDTCRLFCELVLKVPRMPGYRLEALLVDFMCIPRGEGPIDALISYQM